MATAPKRPAAPGSSFNRGTTFASAIAPHGGNVTAPSICYSKRWAWRPWDLLVRLVDIVLPVALPTSTARMCWMAWFVLMVLYSALDVPLHIAFESWRLLHPVEYLNWLSCVSFCLDILLRFRTSYITCHGEFVRTPWLISQHYFRGMFFLDLMSALPLAEIIDLTMGRVGHRNAYWVGVLRIPRLIIVMREVTGMVPVEYYNMVSVVRLLAVMLLCTHWAACIWYYLAFDEIREKWPWVFSLECKSRNDLGRYLFAFYRSFLILLGDRPRAYNDVERVFMLVLLFLGACLYAIIMGSMTLLVSNMWSMASRHKQRAAMLQDMLRYNGAETGALLRARVDNYFDFMATYEHPGAEGVALLSELPTALHSELMSSVFEPLLTRIQLFAFCERAFLWRLAQRLRLCTFMPKDVIYDLGSVGHDMYIIWKGIVVLTEPDGCMTALLCEGDHFGELGVMATITPRPQRAVAMCATDALMLSRSDLLEASRDFPDSAEMVKSRAQVQLEDHEIGPAVWAATMATKQMQAGEEAGDTGVILQLPPRRSRQDKPIRRVEPQRQQSPNAQSSELRPAAAGNGSTPSARRTPPTAKQPWPGGTVQGKHGSEEAAPVSSFWRRQYLMGQAQGGSSAAAGRADPPGPVAEATETGAAGVAHIMAASSHVSVGSAGADSPPVSPRQSRPNSLSSEDSFFDALGLKSQTAGSVKGGAPAVRVPGTSAGSSQQPVPASVRIGKAPRLPHGTAKGPAGPSPAGLVLEEAPGEARQSLDPPSGRSPCEPGPAGQQWAQNGAMAGLAGSPKAGLLAGLNTSGDMTTLPDASGSRSASAASQTVSPFRLASVWQHSPAAGLPQQRTHRQPSRQQPSPVTPANFCGFDPRELAALERIRFSSQRPPDSGGVVRYLSRRARQEASATAIPSGPGGTAVVAPFGPGSGQVSTSFAAEAVENSRDQAHQFGVDDLVEVANGSSGQQRVPTAPQLLFMTPQPFLGPDPLGPLFDQQPLPSTISGPMLGLRWRGKSGAQGGAITTSDGGGLPTPLAGDEDSTTRQLVAPVGRCSIRPGLRGSGRRVSSSNLAKLTSMGSSADWCVDEWLNDQQQQPCNQPRCAHLEQQVAQLKRQLAAAHARIDTFLEDPLKEPSVQALVQLKVQAAMVALSARTEELLQQLLEGLAGISARTEDLSQQVTAADDRLQRLEDEHVGGFGAAVADTAMAVSKRLPPLGVTATGDGGSGGVFVDVPIQGPAEAQGRSAAAPLVGLLRPSGATSSQMGALLPLSTAAPGGSSGLRPSASRQLSLRQQSAHQQRRSSTLTLRSLPVEDLAMEAGAASGGSTAATDTASMTPVTSLPVPDAALLAATMNRAAGKNVRRRQSTRDLSVLASSTIVAQQQQQQQQELRELREQSVWPFSVETGNSINDLSRSVSRELPRTNSSRAEGVRPRMKRSSSMIGMAPQAGEGMSPTASPSLSRKTLRRKSGSRASLLLETDDMDAAALQALSVARTAVSGSAGRDGGTADAASRRGNSGSDDHQQNGSNSSGVLEITPDAPEEQSSMAIVTQLGAAAGSIRDSLRPSNTPQNIHVTEVDGISSNNSSS